MLKITLYFSKTKINKAPNPKKDDIIKNKKAR